MPFGEYVRNLIIKHKSLFVEQLIKLFLFQDSLISIRCEIRNALIIICKLEIDLTVTISVCIIIERIDWEK